MWARILARTQTGAPGRPKGTADPRLHGWGFAFSGPGKSLQEKSARWTTQPIIPAMIAMMKPIAPSQSRSPASVPRLAEMRGSMLLCIIGLRQCRPLLTMVRRLGSSVLTACDGLFSLETRPRHPLVRLLAPSPIT